MNYSWFTNLFGYKSLLKGLLWKLWFLIKAAFQKLGKLYHVKLGGILGEEYFYVIIRVIS